MTSKIMEILERVDGLPVSPVSAGTDQQNRILAEYLPFRVYEYQSGAEHNGWIVPQDWKVLKAEIRKDGTLIYDGQVHPLGVIGYSQSFRGRLALAELSEHLFYKESRPDDIVYHCDLYYKQHLKNWGFCVPFNLYKALEEGEYEIDLQTIFMNGTMKVLEYVHKGTSPKTIILNAHNCHAAQANDGPAAYAVLIEVMRRLKARKTKYTYQVVIAPEHLGTVFYLANASQATVANYKLGIFLEMVGHDNPKFALAESFTGQSLIDRIAHHVLSYKNPGGYWSAPFRKIVGNDETVWEAPGIEVPMISLSRCNSKEDFYPEYHTSADNFSLMSEERLEETAEMLLAMIDILEQDCMMRRKFSGLIALSNPKYNLYFQPGTDPSLRDTLFSDQPKWNYLMDCLPRYFDQQHTILDIAIKHELTFDQVFDYLTKFQDKGLVQFAEKELI